MAKASQLIPSFGLLGFIRVMISMQWVGCKYLVQFIQLPHCTTAEETSFFLSDEFTTHI